MIPELVADDLRRPQLGRGDDRALLKLLARACRSGAVAIEADARHLQHIHSPVLSQADGNQWLITIAVAVGALWWWQDWRWALGALALGAAVYAMAGRRVILRRLMRRVDGRLDDPAAWSKLWDFGGVALREDATGLRCTAPAEDWRGFVRSLHGHGEEGRLVGIRAIGHVQITVSREQLEAAMRFYGGTLG
ncbi:MAG: hypothetical protein ACREIB_13600, partial [Pseudomonadota bacterium]